MIPECTLCARHRKYSLYYAYNMCIFKSTHKLMMPKHELFHSPEEFPFFAFGHTPYDFIYL